MTFLFIISTSINLFVYCCDEDWKTSGGVFLSIFNQEIAWVLGYGKGKAAKTKGFDSCIPA